MPAPIEADIDRVRLYEGSTSAYDSFYENPDTHLGINRDRLSVCGWVNSTIRSLASAK